MPFADDSVDLIVTSPPYFALRTYTDGGAPLARQIGAEPTWQLWLNELVLATREMVRVLKPTGSIFVNLGDKYSGHWGAKWGQGRSLGNGNRTHQVRGLPAGRPRVSDIAPKSLMLLPERFRIACVDALGLHARAVIVWDKQNSLPESVRDRVRRSHEEWVHLTKSPAYYAAVDLLREPHTAATRDRAAPHRAQHGGARPRFHEGMPAQRVQRRQMMHPLGALPRSVWRLPAEPLRVPPELGIQHFAAFPTEWPRRLITGWSPPGICTACGQGRFPVAGDAPRGGSTGASIAGFACACTPHRWVREPGTRSRRVFDLERFHPPPTRPAVVLDPFGGSGTVAFVAALLGRHGISIDLSADYSRIAAWRCSDSRQHARFLARCRGVGEAPR